MIRSNVGPIKKEESSQDSTAPNQFLTRCKRPIIILAAVGSILLVLGIILVVYMTQEPGDPQKRTLPSQIDAPSGGGGHLSLLQETSTKSFLTTIVSFVKRNRFASIGVAAAVVLAIIAIVVVTVMLSTNSDPIPQPDRERAPIENEDAKIDEDRTNKDRDPHGGGGSENTDSEQVEEPAWKLPLIITGGVVAVVVVAIFVGVAVKKKVLDKPGTSEVDAIEDGGTKDRALPEEKKKVVLTKASGTDDDIPDPSTRATDAISNLTVEIPKANDGDCFIRERFDFDWAILPVGSAQEPEKVINAIKNNVSCLWKKIGDRKTFSNTVVQTYLNQYMLNSQDYKFLLFKGDQVYNSDLNDGEGLLRVCKFDELFVPEKYGSLGNIYSGVNKLAEVFYWELKPVE